MKNLTAEQIVEAHSYEDSLEPDDYSKGRDYFDWAECLDLILSNGYFASAFCQNGTEHIGSVKNAVYTDCNAMVEGKDGTHINRQWMLRIGYRGCPDAYTVIMFDKSDGIIYENNEVYCDMLNAVLVQAYDEAIIKYNNGFICI